MIERQELHCHNCDNYVQFNLDLSRDDNYVLDCPKCGHKHYRVVRDGKITDERWGQDPSQNQGGYTPNTQTQWTTISATTVTVTATSTYNNYMGTGGTSSQLYGSWMNMCTAC